MRWKKVIYNIIVSIEGCKCEKTEVISVSEYHSLIFFSSYKLVLFIIKVFKVGYHLSQVQGAKS